MTAQAFENRIPPPEAIRGALLLGVVVGQRDDLEELPACTDCKKHLLQLHEMVFGEPPAEAQESAAVPTGDPPTAAP